MVEQITLYANKACPCAQRVEIALLEAGAEFTRYEIDLQNKPEWFPKVNPVGQVPAITYGGPVVSPDQPSPESTKIAESLVIVEFIADLFPESKLLPKDPVLRAKAPFFIDAVSTKLMPAYVDYFARGESPDGLVNAIETLQALLPSDKTFAVSDDFTIADISLAPFLARALSSLKNDVGATTPGEGKKAYEVLNSKRFSKIQQYYKSIEARDSFKKTFDEELILDTFRKRLDEVREQYRNASA